MLDDHECCGCDACPRVMDLEEERDNLKAELNHVANLMRNGTLADIAGYLNQDADERAAAAHAATQRKWVLPVNPSPSLTIIKPKAIGGGIPNVSHERP